ncbi:hypothetical protein BDF14DRAFT_1875670 [Spinellus fusiger]|nr:hypothetical protein BDF14DRAFT_1875670 [Spinellus fusiger]
MSSINSPRRFRIRTPCSTANIGPGFDVLGISLSLYLTLDVEVKCEGEMPFEMTYSGEGAGEVPLVLEHNLITKTALYVLSANGIPEFPSFVKIHVENPIPLGRGLGSSGAAVVAGVLLGNALGQLNMSQNRLLDYCLMIERHPDNVAAALVGGFVASYLSVLSPEVLEGVPTSESLLESVPCPNLPQPPHGIGHFIRLGWAKEIKAIAIVPEFKLATAKARAILPTTYERQDIIFNFQRLAVLTTALGQSPPNTDLIFNAMQDKIHQPYRKTLIPGLPDILSSITPDKYDGLLGICLSGAGPTILALATKNFDAIAEAAQAIFKEHGDACSASPLYTSSYEYGDSCDNVYLYCNPITNTCSNKGCTNADYLKGWDVLLRKMPDRCTSTTYCPDNNSQCRPLLPVGASCELQRDDECTGNLGICLNSTCFIKGAPLNGNCGSERTTYISYNAGGFAIEQTIVRDNCTLGTYCGDISACIPSKPIQESCSQDRECLSGTCSNGGLCVNGPEIFHTIQPWLWGVLAAAVAVFVCVILGALWVLHRYQSNKEHEKIAKFFGDNEQFGRYAMAERDDDASSYDGGHYSDRIRNPILASDSVVYLTTPDYLKSSGLSTNSWRNNASATRLRDTSTPREQASPLTQHHSTPELH